MGSKKNAGKNQHYHGNRRERSMISRSTNSVDALMQEAFDSGYQRACDLLALTLHDPEVMGKDILGERRIVRVYDGMRKHDDEYWQAWTAKKEADYKQDKLDRELRAIFARVYKDRVVPFNVRYNLVLIPGYAKARKGWK